MPSLTDLPYPTKDSPAPDNSVTCLLTRKGFRKTIPGAIDNWRKATMPSKTSCAAAFRFLMRPESPLSIQTSAIWNSRSSGDGRGAQTLRRLCPRTDSYSPSECVPPLLRLLKFRRKRIAPGYRWEDNVWKDEPIPAHGSFELWGGLWTTANDLARYVAT